jgi:hypothetical protein
MNRSGKLLAMVMTIEDPHCSYGLLDNKYIASIACHMHGSTRGISIYLVAMSNGCKTV